MKEPREDWEKEFDEKFVASITSSPGNTEHARAVIFFEDQVKIKDFIRSLLLSKKKETVDEIERRILNFKTSKRETAFQDTLFTFAVNVLTELKANLLQ